MYLETGSLDPAYNLAFEEYVLTRRLTGEYLILWQNDSTVVIGRNQNAEEEINRAFVERHHVRVIRRETGGGAVYHDLGNLNYSFIADAGEIQMLQLSRFTGPVVEALRGLGIPAEASGRNDILVRGKKVSGTAQKLYRNRILHHGTLLFDSDLSTAEGALNVDASKFRSKAARSVKSRIGNIRDFLPEDMDMGSFWGCLTEAFGGGCLEKTSLTEVELSEVRELAVKKYSSWEWNFGSSPDYNVTNRRRYPAGSVEFRARVEKGGDM